MGVFSSLRRIFQNNFGSLKIHQFLIDFQENFLSNAAGFCKEFV